MIRVQCKDCRAEYRISNVIFLGAHSYIDVLVEPECSCFDDESILQSDFDSLEDAYDELYERNEEGYREYKKVLKESKELRWKRKYKALQCRIDEYISTADFEKARRVEFQEELKRKERKFTNEQQQLISNHNLVMDELDIKFKEAKMGCKKLSFENDKLMAKMNGGNYSRSVDL